MPRAPQHPVRRCAPCDTDWPNTSAYNLCPRCQRSTYASTDPELPNTLEAAAQAKRYAKIREFDAACDAGQLEHQQTWAKEMDALLALTPSIADPYHAPQTWDADKGRWTGELPWPFATYDPEADDA